jgi:triacylglycerol esterase/lipase EstA (alpha/beta hydrolase family)
MSAGTSPTRRRPVVLVAVLGIVCAAVLATVLLLGPSDPVAAPGGEPPPEELPWPVLLVPGYGGRTTDLQSLADRLRSAARDVTVVALPDDGTGDLAGSAAELDRAAVEAMDRTGAESVDVVGFSAGGLIARLWVAGTGADVARRVVTLGSPHHGTTVADLATRYAPDRCPLGCQQMATASALLATLNAVDETPGDTEWISIWTTQDTVVTPPDSARLDGALNLPVQSVCVGARLSHNQLPGSPLVHEMVLLQLGTGKPEALGPDDCARIGG